MKKQMIVLIVICLSLNIAFPTSYQAKNRTGHDSITKQILLNGRHGNSFDENEKKTWKMLTSATYLAIDQFNNNGQDDLDLLKEYKVKGLPSDISEINVTASANKSAQNYHRKYTHIGWNERYITKSNREFWLKRRAIIENTVDKIFDFDNSVYNENKNIKQKDSFCQLLYYTHIIGDHLEDKSYEHNVLKIELGGRTDKIDVINDLLKLLPSLFPHQKHTQSYSSLKRELIELNVKIKDFVKLYNSNINDEVFVEYKKFTKELKTILVCYIPGLLKEEPFFKDVFY